MIVANCGLCPDAKDGSLPWRQVIDRIEGKPHGITASDIEEHGAKALLTSVAFDPMVDPQATFRPTLKVHRFYGGTVLEKLAGPGVVLPGAPEPPKPAVMLKVDLGCAHPSLIKGLRGDSVGCSQCSAMVSGQEFAHARQTMSMQETESRVFTMALAAMATVDAPVIMHPRDKAAYDALANDQSTIDANRSAMAQEIVDAQKIETVEEGRRFAKAWIETAAQHASNEEYWEKRARDAERILSFFPKGSVEAAIEMARATRPG